jgi:hypothetical protein
MMKWNHVIATACLWSVVLALLGVGVHYMTASQPMPHHMQILDVEWTALTPHSRALMMTFMKGTGLLSVSTAVSLAVLLAVPFRRREPWSRWAILLVGAVTLVPTFVGAVDVQIRTGHSSPWWPHVVLAAALIAGVILTRDFKRTA